jgi:hypothetical protein
MNEPEQPKKQLIDHPSASIFYSQLLEVRRRKVTIERIRKIYADVHTDRWSHPDRIAYLHADLQSLFQSELIVFPSRKNPRAWLTETTPNLPAWISLRIPPSEIVRLNPASIPWLPELAFCAELIHPSLIETAFKINEFLIARRHNLIPVPLRERSLQIFGNEKKLDSLARDGALFSGRLPLSVIGAFEVEHPLSYRASGVAGKPVLVIENHHTFWSFCEWNQRVGQYSAIVYGSGNFFAKGGRAIDEVLADTGSTSIKYFGDLDPMGLEIPARFNRTRAKLHCIPAKPELRLYQWLLSNGTRRNFSDLEYEVRDQSPVGWLGASIEEAVNELFHSKYWIPQESLGTEVLLTFDFVKE